MQHCASLAAVKAVDPRGIDLALSGMHLPDGTGLDAFALLTARRSDLPFVVVTGEARADLAIEAIARGACDYVLKAGDYLFAIPVVVEKNLMIWKIKQDNLRLQEQLSQTLEEVRFKNQQLEEAVRMLEAMAGTDPLTGLANRRSFNQAMDRAFASASRYNHDLACIMLDLDNFKQYNDTFGHQRGDDVLRTVARVLEANCRRSDVAGRFGGDEFIVLLPETDLATAEHVSSASASSLPRPSPHWAGKVERPPWRRPAWVWRAFSTLGRPAPNNSFPRPIRPFTWPSSWAKAGWRFTAARKSATRPKQSAPGTIPPDASDSAARADFHFRASPNLTMWAPEMRVGVCVAVLGVLMTRNGRDSMNLSCPCLYVLRITSKFAPPVLGTWNE